jgi:N-acetylneuraminate synthase
LLEAIRDTGKPVLLATGASTMDEVWRAADLFGMDDLTLMQCTTNYSGDPDNVRYCNLAVLRLWSEAGYDVGLSDHTRSLAVAVAAVVLGASAIERHFTDDRTRTGSPDHPFAMEPADWGIMRAACEEARLAMGDEEKHVYECEHETRIVQRRGLWDGQALRPCLPGHELPW